MKNFGKTQTFSIRAGQIVIPSIDMLYKKTSSDIATIIYYASTLLFLENITIKQSNFELVANENRLTVYIDEKRRDDSPAVTFLTHNILPFLLAIHHTSVEIKRINLSDFSHNYLLLKIGDFEDWFGGDYTTRRVLELIVKTSLNGEYNLVPNFNYYSNKRNVKHYDSLADFDHYLSAFQLKKSVKYILEKAFFDLQ
jgi:hypothetical protein